MLFTNYGIDVVHDRGSEGIAKGYPQSHFWQHIGRIKGAKARTVLWAGWVALVWAIWQHRNAILLEDGVCDLEAVYDECIYKSWYWNREN